ncbi:DUF7522 family protein [Halobacterium bonnevillei]|uniref:Uncharacterized protein n=1 Tax=Halobacterium bonnevillei TaxID=2692200 RepID=A0A6B0SLQ5_9EURY|nr:hypothetical protein [Halobacterium bonnevillei]MXR22197.1 hypothetical protein [Halobacterium bonnevillei]
MTAYDTEPQSDLDGGKAALVDALRDALGENLRDVWVLDQRTQEPLYVRTDVADRIEDVDVEKHIDNERYGFVTRQTYNLLHYSEFRYTHRGFDTWELFRTFVAADGQQVGVLVGVDSDGTNYDFGALTDTIHDLGDEYGIAAFQPIPPEDR